MIIDEVGRRAGAPPFVRSESVRLGRLADDYEWRPEVRVRILVRENAINNRYYRLLQRFSE